MPHRRRIPFKKSQDDNPFFEKGKRKTKERQTFIRINKKKRGGGNPTSYFRAVLSPPAKLNLFGRKRRKFEEESGERMRESNGKEGAEFAESSIASQEIRRPFQFYSYSKKKN